MDIRKIAAVLKAASKDETRYNLNGVCFERSGAVVATNGHMLIAHLPDGKTADEPGDSMLVPVGAVAALCRAVKGDVERDGVRFSHSAGAAEVTPIADAEFPNWRALRPRADVTGTVTFDPACLKTICDAALKAGDKHVTLELHGELDATLITSDSLYMLLMPCIR